jgi:hypothetical protein
MKFLAAGERLLRRIVSQPATPETPESQALCSTRVEFWSFHKAAPSRTALGISAARPNTVRFFEIRLTRTKNGRPANHLLGGAHEGSNLPISRVKLLGSSGKIT